MSATNGFTGLKTVPENADIFASQEFSKCDSDSLSVAIQTDTTLMTDKVNPNYTVMGSNISGNVGDMVPVKDESGAVGPFNISTPFVKNYFPFKYIGIQYTANGNVGAGTFFMTYVQKVQRVNLV